MGPVFWDTLNQIWLKIWVLQIISNMNWTILGKWIYIFCITPIAFMVYKQLRKDQLFNKVGWYAFSISVVWTTLFSFTLQKYISWIKFSGLFTINVQESQKIKMFCARDVFADTPFIYDFWKVGQYKMPDLCWLLKPSCSHCHVLVLSVENEIVWRPF